MTTIHMDLARRTFKLTQSAFVKPMSCLNDTTLLPAKAAFLN